jgi:calnexin
MAADPQAIPGEKMIFMKSSLSYYGLSTEFPSPIDNTGRNLIIQYEIREQDPITCGGSSLKLFPTGSFAPSRLCNETEFLIMFGPDKCGSQSPVHFIFSHKNPKTGQFEQKKFRRPPQAPSDPLTHLYTLIIRIDNTFEILIDTESVATGSLLKDFYPPLNPPKTIPDPADPVPKDWVTESIIDDPTAVKPADWPNEPEFLPIEGTPSPGWLFDEPPIIIEPKPIDFPEGMAWHGRELPNPNCAHAPGCGPFQRRNPAYRRWVPPQIPNPGWKGPWKGHQIPNPDFWEDLEPHNFPPIAGVGFEVWMVDQNIGFDNVYIGYDEKALKRWNDQHFLLKKPEQSANYKPAEGFQSLDMSTMAHMTRTGRKIGTGEYIQRVISDLLTDHPLFVGVGAWILFMTILGMLAIGRKKQLQRRRALAAAKKREEGKKKPVKTD